MSVMVRIPTPLRRVTNGQDKVNVEGGTLSEVVGALENEFPGIRERLCDDTGALRNFVNVYVNGEDVRFLDGAGHVHQRRRRDQHSPGGGRRSLGPRSGLGPPTSDRRGAACASP